MYSEKIYSLAIEMLQSTKVYRKELKEINYKNGESLLKIVNSKARYYRSSRTYGQSDLKVAYGIISEALFEYYEDYPSTYSFKQSMKEKFCLWLNRIKEKYKIEDVEIPEIFQINPNERDTAIVMLKELHSRKGITKEDLLIKLGITNLRSVQKNLRKLSPKLYEGPDFEKGNVYVPFRIGGQPIEVDIESFEVEGSCKKYYRTRNTVHPIVLQENLMQVGTLLQSLGRNYWENESEISLVIATDIWSQLSDYAKTKIELIYTVGDVDLASFIEILKDACPDQHACVFRTEREMIRDIDFEMSVEDALKYLLKSSGRTANVIYSEKNGEKVHLKKQRIEKTYDEGGEELYIFVSEEGSERVIRYQDISDIIVNP